MKIDLVYRTVAINVDTDAIADSLELDASDDDIKRAIAETVDVIATEEPWPPYSVHERDQENMFAAVKKALKGVT